jgi:hypothetical protein
MGGGGLNMGYVIYEGPSLLSGNPIVAIAIPESRNTKAGGLLQVFVMCQDTPPLEALKSGADADVCGDCVARPIDGGKTTSNCLLSIRVSIPAITLRDTPKP